MKLPQDLLTQTYKEPDLFLCEVDKTKICRLETSEMKASLKFNSYSELTCTIGRTYVDMITGENKVNPFYDKIEALRLLYLEGFGYFEIQDPEIISDGIMEAKEITAYSLEYTLSQKYLTDFYVNTGEADSLEVINGDESNVVPITLYDILNPKLSLLNLILEKIYGWSIGHVDASLQTMSRTFEISRRSVYDFIVQDLCSSFNCFAVFDTTNNTINLYAEALITKFIGDGFTNIFVINPPYEAIETVTVDTYKTTAYQYEPATGKVIFDGPPANGARIEVIDGSQKQWMTDVYVSFENLVQEINISYSAEDIKTVLTVKGANGLDIREVNMGLPYITDLSYYYTVDWMGQELFDDYTDYVRLCNSLQDEYMENAQEMLMVSEKISYEEQRLSLQYSRALAVDYTTVGTYYVRGGDAPNYYYTAVTLPADYNINSDYYTLSGNDITETKVANLFAAMQNYYVSGDEKKVQDFEALSEDFQFVEGFTIKMLVNNLVLAEKTEDKDAAIKRFLNEMWDQLGRVPLKTLYYQPYKELQATNIGAGWDKPDNENYWRHHPVIVILESIEDEFNERRIVIEQYEAEYLALQERNNEISNDLLVVNNFTPEQLVKLNSFLREDEYTDNNFAITNSDTTESIMKLKQELLECGRIELQKLCEPKLGFSMNMANIYALPEFQPIIHQFQLGNLIMVALRSDYVKRARLLQVDINFKDFSDFSCEFGELSNLRTPSSIHADLLSSAMIAGHSVASNSSYWSKGSDLATATDLKIQQGLLSATNGLYTSDKSVVIDNTGILLRRVIDKSTGEFSPNQAWLTENNILYSTDAFKTSRTGLGEFVINGQTFYGVLAEAMFAGYIEGSTIKGSSIIGGTINIGDGTFVVEKDGSVVMKASSIDGYVSDGNVISSINQSPESITINADKISLAGKSIDLTSDDIAISSTNFSVTKDGQITATSGEIAGWAIYDHLLRKETTIDGVDYQMYMQAADGVNTSNAFAVRKKNSSDSSWDAQFAVNYEGKMTAKNANITGTITAKDGSIAGYNIGPGGSYSNAIYKRVDGESIDYEVGMKATSGNTDLAFYVKESTDNWANSTNTFYIRNDGKLYAKNADITGTINATSGTIGGCSISNGVLNVDAARITSGTIATARIPNLSADKITAGTIHVDRIPSLNADKITVGTLHADRIPNISADKITVGTLHADRIPNISASKITTGTLSADRLSSSVITTGNFSAKTLSSGNISVTSGGNIGAWTINSNGYLYAISGNYGVSLSPASVSHGQGGSATWVNVVKAGQNASDERLKTNILALDEKLNVVFDNLRPVQFEYSKEFLGQGKHFGYIAQDVIKSFEDCGEDIKDYSFIYETELEDNSEDKYYQLNKSDFIALNTWQIQKLKARIEELENKLATLET